MSPNKGSFFSTKSSDGIREIYKLLYEREGKTAGSLVILDLYLDLTLFTFTPGREQHGKEYQNV